MYKGKRNNGQACGSFGGSAEANKTDSDGNLLQDKSKYGRSVGAK